MKTVDLQDLIIQLKKWARLSKTPYCVEDEKSEAVQNFSNDILDDFKYRHTQKERISKLSLYSDLFKIQYIRTSFWEKLTRSKKHPRIQYLKNSLTIFDELYRRDSLFATSFCRKLQYNITELEKKVRKQRDEIRKITPVEGREFDEDGDYLPDKLALVHVTDYKPKKDGDGCYVIETLAQATDFFNPRNTIHFAINHHVKSHLMGVWDDKPYVVVASMKETIEENGKPVYIDSRDTYFEFGVDEKMRLPKGSHLIEPADKKLPQGTLWITKGNRTVYKSKEFTEDDTKTLLLNFSNAERCAFDSCSSDTEREKLLTAKSKKMALASFLQKKGYANIRRHEAEHDSHENITQMANMARKMGVGGGRDDHHAFCAISGHANFIGSEVNNFNAYVELCEQLLNAKRVVKKDGVLVLDEENVRASEVEYGFKRILGLGDMSNARGYFDRLLKERRDNFEKLIAPQFEEIVKKYDQVERQKLPFEKTFFKKIGILCSHSYTSKEQEVFMVWVDKTQQRIDNMRKIADGRTLDEIIQSKSTNLCLTSATARGGER